MTTIAVTGHRPKYLGNEYGLIGPYSNYVRKQLRKIIEEYRPDKMISGLALGVDTIWAELAISYCVPLIVAIPFEGQGSHWKTPDKNKYIDIVNKASERHVISTNEELRGPHGRDRAYHKRDEWMVDNADLVVAVLSKKVKKGGTVCTAKYAEKTHVPVIYVDPNGWKP